MRAIYLGFLLAVIGCSDDNRKPSHPNPACPGTQPCNPGDTCAGFESDYFCNDMHQWQCLPSGNVGDPCNYLIDAGVDAPRDAIGPD